MKKKLQLSTLLKVQKHLEELVLTQQKYISDYNDTEMKVDKALDTIAEAENELVKIKEAVQEANKSKHADGKTNNFYIYTLSNLNAKKRFLQTVKTSDKSQLTETEINKKIAEINVKIDEIRSKLTEFNSKEISIELNEELIGTMPVASKVKVTEMSLN
jgi:low affinity Fe/Cu permease